ncbi:hypothetical protein T492DRAFT_886924 [Pavlovales sp. CCMP2436]|nr:hypothetical protein T492DRAFT_886924 [Pavlovales sp. CCMP2436]
MVPSACILLAAGLAASVGGALQSPGPGDAALRFYVYPGRDLDMSWLAECPGFSNLKNSAEGEGMQEANLYEVSTGPRGMQEANLHERSGSILLLPRASQSVP